MHTYQLKVNGNDYTVEVTEFSSSAAKITVNGEEYEVAIEDIKSVVKRVSSGMSSGVVPASPEGNAPRPLPTAKAAQQAVASTDGSSVKAPIPGAILEIFVEVGDKVSRGEPLIKMEAMKMENEIAAPSDGTVTLIHVGVGDAVNQGQELIVIS